MQFYLYNPKTMRFAGIAEADEKPEYATTASPFDENNQAKIGTTYDPKTDTWQAPIEKPTSEQTTIEQLGVQMASLTVENQNLKQANQEMGQTVSTLGMQVAQLLAKEQGGN